jgi:hypothetical protein
MPPKITFEQQVLAMLKQIQEDIKELAQRLDRIENNQVADE